MPNVWNGDVRAMIPAMTNSTPSTPCSHFQASTKPISTSSLTPANTSTKPGEVADQSGACRRRAESTTKASSIQMIPVTRNSHHHLDICR